ncbi:probable dolichyl pyrophosphate Glc1Man9GlcNAc2 alpha-1,3-glucosyltransferase [Venturia canescens]|uniref:probable dolichyl pyrophosphate Glc1Man9GlcNAc2 alpha-1,3-glucosyltransferase n=1 Tax=Venturia canescens TaxID=32260 RepID=UPI001C9C1AFB|nr:probable dolichyl pyrophosphate Glc1Man9GlcNAc2 alpha-1,3-glucosyltransferase [Venturia canescens]
MIGKMPAKPMKSLSTKKDCVEKLEQCDYVEKSSETAVILKIFALITCIKCLLVPTYHSTDFEVHRNWLAITHNLSVKEWYVNEKSQWTLDYPPLFAWFEYFLSRFAIFADPGMLNIDNLNYASNETVLFQRATVIISDLVLAYGVKELGKGHCKSIDSFVILTFLTLCNVGLLIVDHIHFQYNGFLLGLLLLSIARVSENPSRGRILMGAVFFAVLLNLKHIYLYVVPAYIVWLLKWYCLRDNSFFKRFIALGSSVLCVLAISFGPFVSQLPQVISRLFPFKRGLVHAYWAANTWALYIGVDKISSIIWKRLGWLSSHKIGSMTGGLVQEESFAILPTPTPLVTFLLTFLSMMPALWTLFRKDFSTLKPRDFIRCVVICGLSSFMFGWHVHEKAILTAIIPLCVLAATDSNDARVFLILSAAGQTALSPLLYPMNLTPLKIILNVSYMSTASLALTLHYKKSLLSILEWIYVGSLPFVTIYEAVLHKWFFGEKLPFLPLAVTSIYCALGITYSWLIHYRMFLNESNNRRTSEIYETE